MKAIIEIDMSGAAFWHDAGEPTVEASELLFKVGCRVEQGEKQGTVTDSNGNACGTFRIEE